MTKKTRSGGNAVQSHKEIFRKVISEIVPKDKSILKKADDFVQGINNAVKSLKYDAEAVLGGSVAKGTNLSGSFDVDIFVKFSQDYADNEISGMLENLLKKARKKYVCVHGSRDYFQVSEGITFEIVPVISVKTSKEARNVADMSPLHVVYFNRKAGKSIGVRNEIRLAKMFMKAARVYGAESYIKGFSGHVADILILHYGSFDKLLSAAAKWKTRTIIDIEKHHRFPEISLNASKIQSPLILVDPVQPERNASAALSKENYDRFMKTCKGFLKNPSMEYFRLKPFGEVSSEMSKNIKKPHDDFIVEIKPVTGKRDVVGSKVMKIKEFIEASLEKNDFELLGSDWEFNQESSKIFLAIGKEELSKEKTHKGPTSQMNAHAKEFRKKYKETFIQEGIFYAKVKRKYTRPQQLLKVLIADSYATEKAKKISFRKI